jgi:hypothetical protein
VTAPLSDADDKLKARIAEVEDEVKSRKAQDIFAYFEACKTALKLDFLLYENVGKPITLTASKKALKEEIRRNMEKIASDYAMILTLKDASEILVEFKKTLDAARSILAVKTRHEAIDDENHRREKARESLEYQEKTTASVLEAAQKSAQNAHSAVAERPAPEETSAQFFRVNFSITSTLAQLKSLKKFLESGGYDYEQHK